MPSSYRKRYLTVEIPTFRRIIFLFMWVVRSTTSVCSTARVNANQRFAAASAPFGATVIYSDSIAKTLLYYNRGWNNEISMQKMRFGMRRNYF